MGINTNQCKTMNYFKCHVGAMTWSPFPKIKMFCMIIFKN